MAKERFERTIAATQLAQGDCTVLRVLDALSVRNTTRENGECQEKGVGGREGEEE